MSLIYLIIFKKSLHENAMEIKYLFFNFFYWNILYGFVHIYYFYIFLYIHVEIIDVWFFATCF